MNSIPKKLKFVFIVAFLAGIQYVSTAQDNSPTPWEPDPRTYIQDKAVQASVDQNIIQDSLDKEKSLLASLENRLAKTNQSSKGNTLRAEIRQSKNKIKDLQARLTLKILEGKAYKEMMPLSDQEIRLRLAADQLPGIRGDTVAGKDQNETAAQSRMPATRNPEVKPKSEVVQADKLISQEFDPWAGLSSSELLEKQDCQFQSNPAGANPRSGMALQPEVLFNHTPEEIKKYLNGQNYLTGEAFVATEPGYTYLQLKLNIASDQALKHYGNLEKSVMVVYFINGKELKLVNSRFDAGYVDQVRKHTSMTGVYYLEKAMVKMLMSSEVDKIRLNFSSGYEDYTVYNIDFFTRQLTCINASK